MDLGCGSGTNVVTLARHGWEVTGVDFAPRAIRIAESKARRAGVAVSLMVGDVTKLTNLRGPFDLALDLGCFHGIDRREAYLSSLDRVLAPAGFWLLYAFFRDGAGSRGPGLIPGDLERIRDHGFEEASRTDGIDRRGRPSAWFLYRKRPGAA